MESLLNVLEAIDGFVWGPPMLVILVGTGIICTFRTGFLCWRNLGYSLKTTLSRESRETPMARNPFKAASAAAPRVPE